VRLFYGDMNNTEKCITAKPTIVDGITFRSRLEARFYEFMRASEIEPEYEPDHFPSVQQYVPDFWIEDLDLYIEVKPKALRYELHIFWGDIVESPKKWICVDQENRSQWRINWRNLSFLPDLMLWPPLDIRFEFNDFKRHYPAIKLFTEYIEYTG
jgi:hypothetical protein